MTAVKEAFADLARILILFGFLLVVVGALLLAAPRLPLLGRLPGDIRIEGKEYAVYVPLGTSLLLSALATFILWLLRGRW